MITNHLLGVRNLWNWKSCELSGIFNFTGEVLPEDFGGSSIHARELSFVTIFLFSSNNIESEAIVYNKKKKRY